MGELLRRLARELEVDPKELAREVTRGVPYVRVVFLCEECGVLRKGKNRRGALFVCPACGRGVHRSPPMYELMLLAARDKEGFD